MKSILIPLSGAGSDATAMETALSLAALFGAHADALHVRVDPLNVAMDSAIHSMIQGASGILTAEFIEALRKNTAERAVAARREFDTALARHAGAAGVSARYEEVTGEVDPVVARESITHDLVVFGYQENPADFASANPEHVLIRCGRPLLLASSGRQTRLDGTIAIAWKETPEAARAVTAAMPLLEKAHRVEILVASEGDRDVGVVTAAGNRLADQLRWHGIYPEVRNVIPLLDVPGALFDAAHGADLLVMGGYGHSRAREFLLGGVTRSALDDPPLPIFLCH